MSKKLSLLCACLAIVAVSLRADDKVLAEVTPETPKKVTRGKASWEGGVLKCTLPCTVIFPTRFKVDPSKIYALSAEIRSTSGNPTSDNVWLGFLCFNEKGQEITSLSTFRFTPVLAELAEPAAKGDKLVVFKSVPWTKILETSRYFAIGAKADRSDIPNMNLVRYVAKSAEKRADGTVAVKLSQPLPVDAPAGTKVAIHSNGDTYQFVSRKKAGTEWTSFSGSYASKAENGVIAFRPTTVEIAFGFFCRDKEGSIEVRKLKLVESED